MKRLQTSLAVIGVAAAAVFASTGAAAMPVQTAKIAHSTVAQPMADEYGGSFATKAACENRGNVALSRGAKSYKCVWVVPHPTANGIWELFVYHWI